MATAGQWIEGARLRTLPNAVAPVVVGTGAAAAIDGLVWWRAGVALLVALALIIGVNYANDYADGVRGTDRIRVGPVRLVGSGLAAPESVKRAAYIALGVAAVAGLVLIIGSRQWLLLVIGALCLPAAWFYTGGKRPYGYRALGELAVFVFFGPVAVLGTLYVQTGQINGLAIGCSVAVGAFSAAVLVANNLRDIPTDTESGKRTLAVLLGDRDTRLLYLALVTVPFVLTILLGLRVTAALAGLVALPLLIPPVQRIRRGYSGRRLIRVLRDTAVAMLAWSVVTALALAFG
ncbi:MAG TPA: 1,4-dihydroxy-2-naphthoate polyprenyltransferase [Pseudonocardiaceae bacterium]|nr:1,4-dihydroxy-2-naphthoate polyprenyltransferase [Pseudonocardiaceae bacterium]